MKSLLWVPVAVSLASAAIATPASIPLTVEFSLAKDGAFQPTSPTVVPGGKVWVRVSWAGFTRPDAIADPYMVRYWCPDDFANALEGRQQINGKAVYANRPASPYVHRDTTFVVFEIDTGARAEGTPGTRNKWDREKNAFVDAPLPACSMLAVGPHEFTASIYYRTQGQPDSGGKGEVAFVVTVAPASSGGVTQKAASTSAGVAEMSAMSPEPKSVLAVSSGFDVSLAFTPLGWSPSPTPPTMGWNKGFLMVDVRWETPYTDKDDVRYEVWIENASNDWGSANRRLNAKSSGGARQMVLLPATRSGGLKGARLKMTFDYRAPGYSSAPICGTDGKVRYETLPAARPLMPGKYDFDCVVTRCVSNATVVVSRKPFSVTIAGTAEPVFVEGIENGRVYPRLTKTHGEIGFGLGCSTPEARTARVVVRSSAGVVSERSFTLAGTDERIVVPEIPTGGPYTVEVACEGVAKTFTDLYVGDLWIVAGQSNAVGTGGDASLGRKAVPGVQGLTPRYGILQWRAASDGFFESTVGSWVTAAQEFYAATGVPVGLLGFASGSKPIDYFFDDSGEDILQLKPLIERHGQHAAAFFWYQGESDSFAPETWTVYGAKLPKLVAAVRRAANRPDMDVGIVQLARYLWYRDDHFAPLRETQRRFVMADAHAALYATHPYDVNPGDKIHLMTSGYVELGKQIGRSRIACETTGRFTSPGPMISEVRFAGSDRRRLVARFTNADGLTGGEDIGEWFVTDTRRGGFQNGGFVPLAAVKTDAATGCMTLDLSEPAGDGAALSYVYNCSMAGTLRNAGGFPAPAFVKAPVKP